jgi:type IV secretory pathway TrbF-like protein
MSDTSSLSELARFIGQSRLVTEDAVANRRAVNDIVNHLTRRPARQRVSDLLSVVLTLSARTRRMVMPTVEIGLDVFAPGGQRAVRIVLPE